MILVAAIVAASAEVTFGIVLLWEKSTPRVIRSSRVFGM